MDKNRGFVTVATGEDRYYQLAANLYISYKKRGKGRYPFAIICDRKNKYTERFDDVILTNDIRKSTADKLLMIKSPYEESIFIDADTLIVGNIDDLFEVFEGQDDVSVFGCTLPLDSQRGWFTYKGSGKYKPQIKYLISMNGGIYFFKNTEKAKKIVMQALEIIKDYASIDFKYFEEPQDEPLMAMSLVLNGCVPCTASYPMIILPACEEKVSTDYMGNVYEGKSLSKARMIHFSNPRTELFLYHYLHEVNVQQEEWKNKANYYKMKIQYLPKNLRFNLFHFGGALLRKMGLGDMVEKLKKILH